MSTALVIILLIIAAIATVFVLYSFGKIARLMSEAHQPLDNDPEDTP